MIEFTFIVVVLLLGIYVIVRHFEPKLPKFTGTTHKVKWGYLEFEIPDSKYFELDNSGSITINTKEDVVKIGDEITVITPYKVITLIVTYVIHHNGVNYCDYKKINEKSRIGF